MSLFKTAPAFILGFVLLLWQLPSLAQQAPVKITGTVRDESASPVISATVLVPGTTNAVLTDTLGRFSITVAADGLLQITSIGYQTLQVKAQRNLNIVLKASSTSLNDFVVIGYGTARRKDLTGAVAVVGAKDFQKGNIVTPEQLIAGKIAGVSVTSNSGSVGAGSTIRIRGGASLNASNDPLIVIDGLPLSGNTIAGASSPLSQVNPIDIESMTVLKDAASTAIYGSRASNGVILMNTKKGTAGKPVFNFSTQYSVGKVTKELPVLSAAQFRNYVNATDTIGSQSFTKLLGNANTDWQKQIFHAAQSTDNNINVAGSLKKMPYRLSVGFLNQEGILKTDRMNRVAVGVALSPRFFDDHLKVDINLKGSVNQTRFANGGAVSSALYFDPTQPVYAASPFGNYYEWATIDASGINLNKLAPRNPVAMLDLYRNTSNVQRSFGNVVLDYKFHFLPELHANLNVGYDVAKGKGRELVPAYAAINWLDTGRNAQYQNRLNNQVAEFYLNYNKDLPNLKSNLNVTAGYGYYNNKTTNYGYPTLRANGDTVPNSAPPFAIDYPQTRLLSYYGRLIYTYNQKYILAASIRYDGSSRFGPDNRWGTFPSIAATWRINQEDFLKDSKVLSDLKLRLSYGITGNQDGIDAYAYQSNYALGDNVSKVQLGDSTYYNTAVPAAFDKNLKWEQTASSNFGLDFGFFDNRLYGSVDVYYKKTKDLLNKIVPPAGSNFGSILLTNVGNVNNQGVEFTLGAALIRTHKLQWNVNFNVAYNDNTITNLTAVNDPSYPGTANPNGVQINSVGYGVNAFYVYKQLYDKAGKPIEGVFQDLNHDGVINTGDLYHYKTPFARYVYGFSTDITYDRWSLNTVLRANTGNYNYNNLQTGALQANILNPLGYLANSLTEVLYSHFYTGQKLSDYYVQNASFLRMDNLGLGYDVGNLYHNKLGLRLNANVQNVFVITKYKGQDPEVFGGFDNVIYPRPRTYSVGANLRF